MNTSNLTSIQFLLKLRLIFVPYLIIAISTIVLYTFLNWLLIIRFDLIKIDDSIVGFLIPVFIPWIPNLIWLMPRIKLLRFKKDYPKNPVFGNLFISCLVISISLILAQQYITTATGKLTQLNYISEIHDQPPTKYYTARHFYINKNMVHVKVAFGVTNKSRDFAMEIYACVPVFNNLFPDTNKIAAIRNMADPRALVFINDTLSTLMRLKRLTTDSIRMMNYLNPSLVMPKYGDSGKYGAIAVITKSFKFPIKPPVTKISPVAWLAIRYSSTVSNSLSKKEKQQSFKDFLRKTNYDFMNKQLDKFVYLSRLPYNQEFRSYTTAIKSRDDVEELYNDPTILSPEYTPFAERNGNKLAWTLVVLLSGSIIFLIILFLTPLKNPQKAIE
jgi:hypothetical protein